MFTAQIKILRDMGLDKTKHKEAVTAEDMRKFATECTLDNPVGLQEAMFMTLMTHWARRGEEGLVSLTKNSFK